MARIYKATVYHIDYSEDYKDAEDFFITLGNNSDTMLHYCDAAQSESFEWEDDLKINQRGCSREDYDVYLQ